MVRCDAYYFLPSLAESLRINRALKENSGIIAPREMDFRRETRAAEHRKRQDREVRRTRRGQRHGRSRKQRKLREEERRIVVPATEEEESRDKETSFAKAAVSLWGEN